MFNKKLSFAPSLEKAISSEVNKAVRYSFYRCFDHKTFYLIAFHVFFKMAATMWVWIFKSSTINNVLHKFSGIDIFNAPKMCFVDMMVYLNVRLSMVYAKW